MDLWNPPADVRGDCPIVRIFKECPIERHRPRGSGGAQVGQRLFDANRAAGPFDDEHEIEVSVADFADLPVLGSRPERCTALRDARNERDETASIERSISG